MGDGTKTVLPPHNPVTRIRGEPVTKSLNKDASEVKAFFEGLLPDATVRNLALEFFSDSLKFANGRSVENWAVYRQDGLVLRVGPSEVMRVYKRSIVVTVHSRRVLELKGIKDRKDVECEPTKEIQYEFGEKKVSQGAYECKFPTPKADEILIHLRDSHQNWLKEASSGYLATKQTPHQLQQELVEYIATFLKLSLPAPGTVRSAGVSDKGNASDVTAEVREKGDSSRLATAEWLLPEEVAPSESYREGDVVRVEVNRHERNRKARDKCIAHYGAVCQVCGFNFEKKYGEIASLCIHVHHLRPLSEIEEGYDVDPVADLRPVCPNCHAVLHVRRPGFTIEELKRMIGQVRADKKAGVKPG